jgi:hypothetical protein
LNTSLYRTLHALGLFRSLRAVSRRVYRFRKQRQALRGRGLVPEQHLTATYVEAITILREKLGPRIGDYLEFGVCHGSSMACMHDALILTGTEMTRKFGFDSFQGLPPEADHQDLGFFSEGQFDSDVRFTRNLLNQRGIDWKETFLIEGWFKDTCTPAMARECHIRKVGIVMIDCDIYTAAKEALDFAGPLLAEWSVIVFDDWNSGDLAAKNLGEKKAFLEFMEENKSRFEADQLPSLYPSSAVFLMKRIGSPGTADRQGKDAS